MVDCDKVYIQAIRPRVAWVKPLEYEVNIDDTKDIIEALFNDPMDPKATYFETYYEAKERIELEIKLPQVVNKGRKRVEKRLKRTQKESSTLILTEGKGDDLEDGDEEDKEEEAKLEEEDPLRKKGKVIITKPTKSSPVTRRAAKSWKKLKLGEDEVEK